MNTLMVFTTFSMRIACKQIYFSAFLIFHHATISEVLIELI